MPSRGENDLTMTATTVNYKVGNEKLVRVMDAASAHLRGLLEKQGRQW